MIAYSSSARTMRLITAHSSKQPVVVEIGGLAADLGHLVWTPMRPSGTPMPGVGAA
jgi:hypothetical protein